MKQCIEGFVSGRVQGVCYRQFTQEQASILGIDGWVKNLDDGRVAFAACGEPPIIEQWLTLLRQGPPRASVSGIETTLSTLAVATGFHILR